MTPNYNGLQQDDLSRQRRLNKAKCPTHSWYLEFLKFSPTAQSIVYCPFQNCDFVYVLRPGTKTHQAFYDAKRGSNAYRKR